MSTGVHRNNCTERDLPSGEACVKVSTGFHKKSLKMWAASVLEVIQKIQDLNKTVPRRMTAICRLWGENQKFIIRKFSNGQHAMIHLGFHPAASWKTNKKNKFQHKRQHHVIIGENYSHTVQRRQTLKNRC